ncbi:uncharacterized protein [Rutidosis leptorrhynchoides]|uniref:uncharacterized protein n=1 Tax=Rutidosis leptorrhynchoides TaxID=125765 RepID=UPI003A995904
MRIVAAVIVFAGGLFEVETGEGVRETKNRNIAARVGLEFHGRKKYKMVVNNRIENGLYAVVDRGGSSTMVEPEVVIMVVLQRLVVEVRDGRGLKVNLKKGNLYGIGVPQNDIENMANYIDCSTGSTPFTYLGLPIGVPSTKASSWQPIIDKFDKRLSDWKVKSISYGGCTIWNEIIKAGKIADNLGVNFYNSIIKSIGNVNGTKFWHEIWCGSEKFCMLFRRLYMLDSNQNACAADRITSSNSVMNGKLNWSRAPYSRANNELTELNNLLASITLSDKPDSWKWNLDHSDIFTTKALASIPDNVKLGTPPIILKTPRNKLIPQKINIFIWRVILGRILTRVKLDKRNIDLDTFLCPLCNLHVESIEHILFHCPVASLV